MNKETKGVLGVYLINIDSKGNEYNIYSVDENLYKSIIKEAERCSNSFHVAAFVDKYNIRPQDIIVHGESEIWNTPDKMKREYREQTEALLKIILPRPKSVKDEIRNVVRNSYKCWCAKELGLEDVCDHRTAWESWHCLMNRINMPKYCIVVKQPANKKESK